MDLEKIKKQTKKFKLTVIGFFSILGIITYVQPDFYVLGNNSFIKETPYLLLIILCFIGLMIIFRFEYQKNNSP